jgi:hypothetical protein
MSLEDSLRLGLRRAAIAGNFTMHGTLVSIALQQHDMNADFRGLFYPVQRLFSDRLGERL